MSNRFDKEIADTNRRVSNAITMGKVSQVDHEKGRYRVKFGEIETDWIPMSVSRAGKTKTYSSLEVDEQVIMAAPGGDLSQAVIIGAVATQATQAADKGNIHRTVYPDGSVVEYDHEAKKFAINVASGGGFNLNIGGGASIVGDGGGLKLIAPGGIDIESTHLRHNGKNVGDTHVHGGVVPGGSDTDVPSN